VSGTFDVDVVVIAVIAVGDFFVPDEAPVSGVVFDKP